MSPVPNFRGRQDAYTDDRKRPRVAIQSITLKLSFWEIHHLEQCEKKYAYANLQPMHRSFGRIAASAISNILK